MAKPPSLSGSVLKGSTDPDMEVAQYLVQLSGEDINEENESSNSNIYESKNKRGSKEEEEEKEQKQYDVASSTSSNTEEIIGTETEISRPKKRRYRSIASIYGSTKPLKVIILQPKKFRMRC